MLVVKIRQSGPPYKIKVTTQPDTNRHTLALRCAKIVYVFAVL